VVLSLFIFLLLVIVIDVLAWMKRDLVIRRAVGPTVGEGLVVGAAAEAMVLLVVPVGEVVVGGLVALVAEVEEVEVEVVEVVVLVLTMAVIVMVVIVDVVRGRAAHTEGRSSRSPVCLGWRGARKTIYGSLTFSYLCSTIYDRGGTWLMNRKARAGARMLGAC